MLKRVNKSSLYKFLLIIILGISAFLRFFRARDLLGFWYDQGRDALVIWDMLYNNKFTLIGPMMGFTGIFRGAWYYYLIAPFYALGHGNPILPSFFLITTSIVAIYFLYKVGEMIGDQKTAIFASLIAAVSMYLIGASRWFSDPTPTLLISVLLVLFLFDYSQGKKAALPISGLLMSMSLQFSAATEIFYIPAVILIIFLLRKKVRTSLKIILLTIFLFAIPFVPQLLFEFRHPGVQSGALFNFIFHEKTFTYAFWDLLRTRIPFDYNMFASKFWINGAALFAPFFVLFIGLLILNWKKLWHSDKFKILFLLSLTPFIGTLFFVSNLGGVYEYYFTGYYLIWILIFSYVYMFSFKKIFVKFAVLIFLIILLFQNGKSFKKEYSISLDDTKIIAYSNQLAAIDWIYKNAGDNEFNVDEYVPPVIPYAYDYLFTWLGNVKYNKVPQDNQTPLLYTLYEIDLPHPERLQAWLDRQKGIGKVLKEERFGGIVVQERERIFTK